MLVAEDLRQPTENHVIRPTGKATWTECRQMTDLAHEPARAEALPGVFIAEGEERTDRHPLVWLAQPVINAPAVTCRPGGMDDLLKGQGQPPSKCTNLFRRNVTRCRLGK